MKFDIWNIKQSISCFLNEFNSGFLQKLIYSTYWIYIKNNNEKYNSCYTNKEKRNCYINLISLVDSLKLKGFTLWKRKTFFVQREVPFNSRMNWFNPIVFSKNRFLDDRKNLFHWKKDSCRMTGFVMHLKYKS